MTLDDQREYRDASLNPRERRATTMRLICTELESGSDRARNLGASAFGVMHWLRCWADDIDPPIDTGEDE